MMRKSCTVGMRNAILRKGPGNHLNSNFKLTHFPFWVRQKFEAVPREYRNLSITRQTQFGLKLSLRSFSRSVL